jgi:hypothetical protein
VATPGSRFEERTVAETLLSVDGGIEAAFFSGDGSTLTSLDPAHLSPGTAVIGVTGSSGSLSCSGCVDTANIGDGQVTSAAIGDGQVGREQIDPSSVQKRVGTICNTYRAINSVNEDGSAVCEEMTRIRSAQSVYVYANSDVASGTLDREDLYLCFLVRVAFWDVDDLEEDAWCNMTLSADGALWSLDALGEDDSTAKCTMECMEVYPAGRSF